MHGKAVHSAHKGGACYLNNAIFSQYETRCIGTGKSLLEDLILASTNPQYDKRLFVDLPVLYMKMTSSEHVVYITCFECQNKNKKTIFVQVILF